jgi:hypothetical protein
MAPPCGPGPHSKRRRPFRPLRSWENWRSARHQPDRRGHTPSTASCGPLARIQIAAGDGHLLTGKSRSLRLRRRDRRRLSTPPCTPTTPTPLSPVCTHWDGWAPFVEAPHPEMLGKLWCIGSSVALYWRSSGSRLLSGSTVTLETSAQEHRPPDGPSILDRTRDYRLHAQHHKAAHSSSATGRSSD